MNFLLLVNPDTFLLPHPCCFCACVADAIFPDAARGGNVGWARRQAAARVCHPPLQRENTPTTCQQHQLISALTRAQSRRQRPMRQIHLFQ